MNTLMKQVKRILIVILLVSTTSCNDDLPKETQEGRNTFGMLVDGEKWESPTLGYNPDAYYYPGYKCLIIYAKSRYDDGEITIVVNNIDKQGSYPISYKTSVPMSIDSTRLFNNENLLTSYTLLSESESQISFTKMDTVKNIVAATFSMKLVNRNEEIINITSGRFDLNLIVVRL
jgi:hypothetical protein